MGRYYTGDIEGKFWFGIQDSTDASFFGAEPCEPAELEYCFGKEDIEDVEHGIRQCEDALGENLRKLDAYFEKADGYDPFNLGTQLGIPDINGQLEWYARLELGNKILHCLKENGSCSFTAEL